MHVLSCASTLRYSFAEILLIKRTCFLFYVMTNENLNVYWSGQAEKGLAFVECNGVVSEKNIFNFSSHYFLNLAKSFDNIRYESLV